MSSQPKSLPTPKLFKMEPPFENMDGAKVQVTEANRTCVGEIRVHSIARDNLFGIRLDITGPLGGNHFTARWMTLDNPASISSITKTDNPEVPYAITIRR